MLMEKRSIPLGIIFTIITCGIYEFYWNYKVWDSLYQATGRPSKAGLDVVLSLVTCGIYYMYMMYQMGKLESEAYSKYGLRSKDDSILYLILGIVSFGVVSMAIVQSNINSELADAVNNVNYDPQQRP